jgi:hypothetical protein
MAEQSILVILQKAGKSLRAASLGAPQTLLNVFPFYQTWRQQAANCRRGVLNWFRG